MVDGVGKGDTMDGIPGKDATYTGYHYTKAVCETCGGINTNMSKSEYGYLKNVYWLYDCAAAFTQELDETVSYEYTDDTYHTVTTKGGTYCAFCYGTNHTVSRKLERHSMVTEVLPQPANGRFATVEKCSLCDYARYDYTAAKAVIADYYGVVDGKPHTITVSDLSEAGVRTSIRYGNSADKIGLLELTFYVFSRILNLQIHAHIYRSFIRHHKMLGVRIAKRKIEPQKPANPCDTRLCSCIFFVNTRQKHSRPIVWNAFYYKKYISISW